MNSLSLFDNTPFAFQIEHITPTCTCHGKRCRICKNIKCAQAFRCTNKKRGWFASYCKPCQRTYDRNLHKMKLYGVSPEQLQTMQEHANGKCELCGREETRIDTKTGLVANLSVDHDHATGIVRGLLCNHCNRILGMVNDDTKLLKEIAEKAESYLKRY